jgi:hypothetical protein
MSDSVYGFLFSVFSSELLCFVFLVRVILIGVRQNLSLVFICISLVAKDDECILIYLLDICILSFEKCFFQLFVLLIYCIICPVNVYF